MTTLMLIVAFGLVFVYGYRLMSVLDHFLSSGGIVDDGLPKHRVSPYKQWKKWKETAWDRIWNKKPGTGMLPADHITNNPT